MSASELSLADYKDYLKQVKDLEASCYQQRQWLGNMEEQLNEALDSNNYFMNDPIPEPELPMKYSKGVKKATIAGVLLGTIPGLILGAILHYFFHRNISLTAWLIIGVVIGILVAWLWCFFIQSPMDDDGYFYEVRASQYHYSKSIEQDEKTKVIRHRIRAQNDQVISKLTPIVQKSRQELQQTQDLLQQYYNLDVVYPKYRGLVPICTIYEYIESGRCVSLTGSDGAYNLYERELRMNLIIDKLDTVIDKLDSIKKSQYMLYEAIQTSNEQIARLSNAVDNLQNTADSIERNTALSSYYNGITATNAAFMGWLSAYSYDHPNR